jgi:hypothetical protein
MAAPWMLHPGGIVQLLPHASPGVRAVVARARTAPVFSTGSQSAAPRERSQVWGLVARSCRRPWRNGDMCDANAPGCVLTKSRPKRLASPQHSHVSVGICRATSAAPGGQPQVQRWVIAPHRRARTAHPRGAHHRAWPAAQRAHMLAIWVIRLSEDFFCGSYGIGMWPPSISPPTEMGWCGVRHGRVVATAVRSPVRPKNVLDIVDMTAYFTRAAPRGLLTSRAQQPLPQEDPRCLSPPRS